MGEICVTHTHVSSLTPSKAILKRTDEERREEKRRGKKTGKVKRGEEGRREENRSVKDQKGSRGE